MEGRIYIASSFTEIGRGCGCTEPGRLCNDPHFWTEPPSWGICRTDFRRTVRDGDFAFFVLPKYGPLPQMVFAYLKVKETITHGVAHERPELASKRMGNKNPNGNIIVDGNGAYNRFDAGAHREHFDEIKQFYIVGDRSESRMLTPSEIRDKAPSFVTVLSRVFHRTGSTPYSIISRKGRRMTGHQVESLLGWINE